MVVVALCELFPLALSLWRQEPVVVVLSGLACMMVCLGVLIK